MDPVASLSRFERAMLRVSTRRGLMPFVVTVSAVSVVMSVVLTTVLMIAIGGDATEVAQALVIAVAVPAIVAPLATTLLGRLLRAVDAASAELHQLARLDSLTGVRNRRAFTEDVEILLAGRGGRAVVAAMVDIDDFKGVNDRHGHAAGDAALVHLAAALTGVAGAGGVVGRFGGDEFVVVVMIPQGEVASLRPAFDAACDLSTVLAGVAASYGLHVADGPVTVGDALARADSALYLAKEAAGRRSRSGVG